MAATTAKTRDNRVEGDGWREQRLAERDAEAAEVNRLRAELNPPRQSGRENPNQLYGRIQDWMGKLWRVPFVRRCAAAAPLVAKTAMLASQLLFEKELAPRLRSKDLRRRLSNALREVRSIRSVEVVIGLMALAPAEPDHLPDSKDDIEALANDLRRLANELVGLAGKTDKLHNHAPAGRKGLAEARALLEEARRRGLPPGFDERSSIEANLARMIAALGFVLAPGDTTPRPHDRRDRNRRRPQRSRDERPFFYETEPQYAEGLKRWRKTRQETIRLALRYAARSGKT